MAKVGLVGEAGFGRPRRGLSTGRRVRWAVGGGEHRKSFVTIALITREPGAPEPRELRQALFG